MQLFKKIKFMRDYFFSYLTKTYKIQAMPTFILLGQSTFIVDNQLDGFLLCSLSKANLVI